MRFAESFSERVLRQKYLRNDERTRDDVFRRVAAGLAAAEKPVDRRRWAGEFENAMRAGFVPAGRIMSAAGTGLPLTLVSCFVHPLGDAARGRSAGSPGIYAALSDAAEILCKGGGVGYDFSALRPRGALGRDTLERASGPVSYLELFDRSSRTVEAAGRRRGAQMGVLRVDHPDIETFVRAKDIRQSVDRLCRAGIRGAELDDFLDRLRPLPTFNLSVAVTDDFMARKAAGGRLELVHAAEPDPSVYPDARRRADGLWIYRSVDAAALWTLIVETAWNTSEPGVLFIDRINAENNLAYCEELRATNPCGEQPLPDYGSCCLGSLDLPTFVASPFSSDACLDLQRIDTVVPTAVRMLDNVLEVSPWPLPKHAKQAQGKRRVGLGFTGLATALLMLGVRYGSDAAATLAATLMRRIRDAAYRASVSLARERGAFPMFEREAYLAAPFVRRLPQDLRADIERHGIRNSHLLSIAPAGSISVAFADNASSGIEPVYAWTFEREIRDAAGVREVYRVRDPGYGRFIEMQGCSGPLPTHFVTSRDLTPGEHLRMQAAVQPYVDASISKTVNIPPGSTFESCREIFDLAFGSGCKGCTVYRANPALGQVLRDTPDAAAQACPSCDPSPAAGSTHDGSASSRRCGP